MTNSLRLPSVSPALKKTKKPLKSKIKSKLISSCGPDFRGSLATSGPWARCLIFTHFEQMSEMDINMLLCFSYTVEHSWESGTAFCSFRWYSSTFLKPLQTLLLGRGHTCPSPWPDTGCTGQSTCSWCFPERSLVCELTSMGLHTWAALAERSNRRQERLLVVSVYTCHFMPA